jgi:hypothetical protein
MENPPRKKTPTPITVDERPPQPPPLPPKTTQRMPTVAPGTPAVAPGTTTIVSGTPTADDSGQIDGREDTAVVLKPKADSSKSEFWVSQLAILGSLVSGLAYSDSHVVALISLLISAGIYAYCRSPLPSLRPGWKTPAFMTAIVSIVGSVAAALADANLPFLPAGVTREAAIIATGIVAGGYTIYRYNVKKALASRRTPT